GEYIETVRPPQSFPPSHPQNSAFASQLTDTQDTGNKVSRRSQIIGTTNIILGGKTVIQAEVIIRGDLLRAHQNGAEKQGTPVAVAIGRYCFFSKGCELRPPGKVYKGYVYLPICFLLLLLLLFLFLLYTPTLSHHSTEPANTQHSWFSHYPLKIADHVFIGPSSVIEAALIGSHVSIGANCTIGKFAIIKDYVKVLDGTVVPPNTVVPSFSIVAGRPGRVVGEIAEGEIEGMDLRE
ncbi:Dynactin subunit, partial [Lachnellula willkommii]